MGMTRELKINGMPRGLVGEVRLVDRNDFRFLCRNSLQRFVKVIRSFKDVVDADDPDSLTVFLKRHRLVAQDA
jgi:hypothetical protein